MVFPRPVKAVAFDMDGLLFDTERLYEMAMLAAAAELGTAVAPDVIYRTVGLPTPAAMELWADRLGPEFDVDRFWSMSSAKFETLADSQLCLKAGVIELLDHIDALCLPRALVTSTERPTVNHHLAKMDLAERFDAIVAHGDYADGKPHPAPYLAAAEKLAIRATNFLALEDSYNGVRSAAAAGMMTVMVPDVLKATEEMRRMCVAITRDLHEVATLLGPAK